LDFGSADPFLSVSFYPKVFDNEQFQIETNLFKDETDPKSKI